MNKNQQKAFTLAEILITLAIIGIVAALTIPTVVTKYKKKVVEVQLVKTYNTLLNAIKLSEVENGAIETWVYDSGENDPFVKYIVPYLKGSYFKNKPLKELGYQNEIKYLKGASMFSLDGNSYGFKFDDGSILYLAEEGIYDFTYKFLGTTFFTFYVDINGPKGPNAVGKDVFVYELPSKSGHTLKMYGEYNYKVSEGPKLSFENAKKDDIIKKCKDTSAYGDANYCGAWIKLNGWKIPDDYPYEL